MRFKILWPLISILYIQNTFAISSWDSLGGCYKTLSYNGKSLPNSKTNYSVISTNTESLFFIGMDQLEIPVHTLILYRGEGRQSGQTHHYQDLFIQDGVDSFNTGHLTQDFRSRVRYRFSPEKHFRYQGQVRAREIESGIYDLVLYFKLRYKGEVMFEKGHFIIERINCYRGSDIEGLLGEGISLSLDL